MTDREITGHETSSYAAHVWGGWIHWVDSTLLLCSLLLRFEECRRSKQSGLNSPASAISCRAFSCPSFSASPNKLLHLRLPNIVQFLSEISHLLTYEIDTCITPPLQEIGLKYIYVCKNYSPAGGGLDRSTMLSLVTVEVLSSLISTQVAPKTLSLNHMGRNGYSSSSKVISRLSRMLVRDFSLLFPSNWGPVFIPFLSYDNVYCLSHFDALVRGESCIDSRPWFFGPNNPEHMKNIYLCFV